MDLQAVRARSQAGLSPANLLCGLLGLSELGTGLWLETLGPFLFVKSLRWVLVREVWVWAGLGWPRGSGTRDSLPREGAAVRAGSPFCKSV